MKKLFYLVVMCASMLWSCDKDDDDLDVDNPVNGGSGTITMVVKIKAVEDLAIYSFKQGETITIDWGDGTPQEEITTIENVYNEDEEYLEGEFEGGYWTEYLEHEYANGNQHTITIKGNIKGLEAWDEVISLDISECKALSQLAVEFYAPTALDLSGNTMLTELECWNITSLDVSKCTALTALWCGGNNLTSLDVSKCTALTELGCTSSGLTSLDVSKCTALTYLSCCNNSLSATALNRIFNDLPKGKTWIDEEGDEWQSFIRIGDNPGSNTCDTSIAENKGWGVYNY